MRASILLSAVISLLTIGNALANPPILTEKHQIESTPTTIRLRSQHILANTLALQMDGRQLDKSWYTVDTRSGIIRIDSLPLLPASITVSYARMWGNLPSYYFIRKISDWEEGGNTEQRSEHRSIPPRHTSTGRNSGLRIFGSKSIDVSAGSATDLDLNQTLNVRIEGELTDGLRVEGVLSDQARPEVGGISTSISEIDRVALRVFSDKFIAQIGDVDFRRRFGTYGVIRKSLKGLTAGLSYTHVGADATIGGIKSKHSTARFFGRDGVSGPYQLLPGIGESSVSVLPGTDRVYLDGVQLMRGADSDYDIDYLSGELTFSPIITISSRSRIEVDFEYLDENYRQDFIASSFRANGNDSLNSVRFDFIRQADSEDDPSAIDLGAEDVSVLRSAGDSRREAVVSGAVSADSGDGDYDLVIQDGDSIFVFVGPGKGGFRVSFSFFGKDEGDYRNLGGGVFEYVGKGQGEYLPVVQLPLPVASSALSISADVGSRRVRVHLDGAASNNDMNLFSELDDDNNTGFDAGVDAEYMPFNYTDSSLMLVVGVDARVREQSFRLPGRTDPVERGRQWALASDSVFSRVRELTVRHSSGIGRLISMESSYGIYADRGYADADQYSLRLRSSPVSIVTLVGSRHDRQSSRISDGANLRLFNDQAAVKVGRGGLLLESEWSDETDLRDIDTSATGRSFDRYVVRGSLNGLSGQVTYEDRSILRDSFVREFDARETSVRYLGHGLTRSSTISAAVTHRRVHYFVPDRFEQSQLTAFLDYRTGGYSDPMEMSINYRLSRQGVDRTAENYIRVGPGQGDYRLQDSVFVEDPFGDYIRLIEQTGVDEVGVKLERNLDLYLRPVKWKELPSGAEFLNVLSSQSHFRSSEQGGPGERFSMSWLVPYRSLFQESSEALDRSLRQIVKAKFSDDVSAQYTFFESQSRRPNQIPSSSDYRSSHETRLDTRPDRRILISLEYIRRSVNQDSRSQGVARFVEHEGKLSVRLRLTDKTDVALKPAALVDFDRYSDLNVRLYELAANAEQRVPLRGRAGVRFSYQRVESSEDVFFPFQYARGRRPGDNYEWGVNVELRLSKLIRLSATYDGENTPELGTRNRSTVSVRARF